MTWEHTGLTCAFSGFAQSSVQESSGESRNLHQNHSHLLGQPTSNSPAEVRLRRKPQGTFFLWGFGSQQGGHFLHSFCYKNAGRRDMELKRTALKHMCLPGTVQSHHTSFAFHSFIQTVPIRE